MPSFTQEQINAFVAALAARNGAKSISFDNQTVTFDSLEEARDFIAYMERNLTTNTTPKTRYGVVDKGV